MNKRVKAFTIMEVTIAMLLVAIVITITYTVYAIVIMSYSSYNAKNSNMAVLIRLDELLRRDFEKADIINKTETGLLFSGSKLVTYEFRPDGVIRNSGITDTFKVNVQTVNLLFEHATVGETVIGEEETRIDEIKLGLLFDDRQITNCYQKQYSSENLIQRKINAIH